MKQPSGGWPKYYPSDQLDMGKLASVFIIWGIISLLTSWHFNKAVETQKFNLNAARNFQAPIATGMLENMLERPGKMVGPIRVKKGGSVYELKLYASLPVQSWSFVEGEVLDDEKEYLFSFGKELWHETGRDSDGPWRENKNSIAFKVTFPQPGNYYLNFKSESSRNVPDLNAAVTVRRKRGSALPHFWFGVIILGIGLILNEIRNKTVSKILAEFD